MNTGEPTPPGVLLPVGYQEPINSSSNALENAHNAATGECRLFGFTVSSTKGSGQFVQVFDATTLPADGAIPLLSIDVATVTAKAMSFGLTGRWFYRGIWLCNSSTQGSKTIGSADCLFDVQYL